MEQMTINFFFNHNSAVSGVYSYTLHKGKPNAVWGSKTLLTIPTLCSPPSGQSGDGGANCSAPQ